MLLDLILQLHNVQKPAPALQAITHTSHLHTVLLSLSWHINSLLLRLWSRTHCLVHLFLALQVSCKPKLNAEI